MNAMKAKFITLFMSVMFLGVAHIYIHLFVVDTSLVWWAAALALTPVVGFFNYIVVTGKPRTEPNLPWVWMPAVVGGIIGIYASIAQPFDAFGFFYSVIVGLAGVPLYVFWYSRFGGRNNDVIRVGNSLPEFELQEADGTTVSSSSFIGKPTLMIFYRGNWCPLCMAQIKEVAARYRELKDKGVEVILVSPQSHDMTEKLAAKFDVPFRFMVDENLKAARTLNIEAENGLPLGVGLMGYEKDTVLPTVIITDRDGKVLFADLTDNYRVRPEPETFIRIFEASAAAA